MKLAGYVRVSTLKQKDGFGPDEQRAAINAWARTNGHVVVMWAEDAISGSDPIEARSGWATVESALADQTAEAVVVARVDRLARDLMVQETILHRVSQLKARVYSTREGENENLVDDPRDPTRKLIRQFLGSVAEYDRKMILLRLNSARAAKATQGKYAHGAPPYGWTGKNGYLHPIPEEQAALALIASMHKAKATTRAIAEALSEAGHPTKRGGKWTSPVVSRIIARTEHRPLDVRKTIDPKKSTAATRANRAARLASEDEGISVLDE